MIKLGKLTDYAVVVMGQLAKEGPDASRSAHYLSQKTGIPEPTVAKVLKTLAKGDLVASARGVAGGYKLTKAAHQTSLAEIITVIEGPISVVSCVDRTDTACKTQSTCHMKGNWNRVNDAITTALMDIKLTEMVSSPQVVMRGMR